MELTNTRVYAVISAAKGVVKWLGEGTYIGNRSSPDHAHLWPQILLDNGKMVWGYECWWGLAKTFERKFPSNWQWVIVDIDDVRKGQI